MLANRPCLTKEQFIRFINFIKERNDAQIKIGELFENEFEDSIFWPYSKYESALVELLEIAMRDTDAEWISYWIYELNYGEDYKDGCVTNEDGSIIKMQTPEDLYNFLTKERFND